MRTQLGRIPLAVFLAMAVCCALGLALTGCGDDGGGGSSDTATDTGGSDADAHDGDTSVADGAADAGDPDAAADGGDGTGADTAADTAPDTAADVEADIAPDSIADTDVDADVAIPPGCGTDSPESLAGCVQASKIESTLSDIVGPRAALTATNVAVRNSLAEQLEAMGYEVEIDDTLSRGANVVGTLAGTKSPGDVVVVSAHFDTVPNCAGADDNGSGVAGALETARVLAQTTHDRTLKVIFWDLEEDSLRGSWDWVVRQAAADTQVVVSYVYEMIGYYTDEPNSQTLPAGFNIAFAEAFAAVEANDNRGDFIALIGGAGATPYSDLIVEYADGHEHKAIPVEVSAALLDSNLIGDLRRSDHNAFWTYGWPAMMITDTANFRNEFYHCGAGSDALETIDFELAARTVASTVYSVAHALSDDAPTAGVSPKALAECSLVTNGCPDGKKCAFLWNGINSAFPTCIDPVTDEPAGLYESCTRPNNLSGEDTCAEGHFCAFWGLPFANPPERRCHATCDATGGCVEGQVCQALPPASPHLGACAETCDPFDPESCGPDLMCSNERPDIERRRAWTCNRFGTLTEGTACGFGLDLCADGLLCGFDESDGTTRCGKPCDATHPCAGGKTCYLGGKPSPEHPTAGVCN